MNAQGAALSLAAFGTAGWLLENTIYRERYSALFGGRKIPFLPVYALGGLAVTSLAPKLRAESAPWYVRAAIYAATLSAIEFAGCQFERKKLGACSWDYTNSACKNPRAGCVDLSHAVLWGLAGLAAETIA